MCDIEACEFKQKQSNKGVVLFLKTVLHIVYLTTNIGVSSFGLIMWVGVTEDQLKKTPIDNFKKFVACYGTNWNYMFQTVFLFLALSHDALEWMSKQDSAIAKKIRYWRDVIFSGLVVPYTCFVFTMFWSLYSIDRELVFPRVYDVVVPWWFNHCVHSNILALLVIETLLQPRRVPTDRKLELTFNATVGIIYAVVYYSIYFFAGRWLYNVFGIMTWWQVCLFQLLIWASSYVFYELQFPINRLVHGKEPEEQKYVESKPQTNDDYKHGDIKEINEIRENGDGLKKPHLNGTEINGTEKNGLQNKGVHENEAHNNNVHKNGTQNGIDYKAAPFSTKSWSLKYRNSRNQFENTTL